LVSQPLLKQLEQGGVVRRLPYPIVYHKNFNPQNADPNLEMMVVPKLICHAILSEMDVPDKAVPIMCVQHALENILTESNAVNLDVIHLQHLLVLCNKLLDMCVAEHSTLGDAFVTECIKLKLKIVCYHNNICG